MTRSERDMRNRLAARRLPSPTPDMTPVGCAYLVEVQTSPAAGTTARAITAARKYASEHGKADAYIAPLLHVEDLGHGRYEVVLQQGAYVAEVS